MSKIKRDKYYITEDDLGEDEKSIQDHLIDERKKRLEDEDNE